MAKTNPSPTNSYLGFYLTQSQRPLVSLFFILPILATYEIGVLVLAKNMHNGADIWLRQLLNVFGLSGYFLLPTLMIAVLLAWHHTTHQPWKVPWNVLSGMVVECVLYALVLVALANICAGLFKSLDKSSIAFAIPVLASFQNTLEKIVAYLGAGVYEEVLFRLLLIPFAMWLIRVAGGPRKVQLIGAIVATSLLFSFAHYIGRYGDSFEWATFIFRFAAGIIFAVIFVCRGFGIAAGTHAIYDIFVGTYT